MVHGLGFMVSTKKEAEAFREATAIRRERLKRLKDLEEEEMETDLLGQSFFGQRVSHIYSIG